MMFSEAVKGINEMVVTKDKEFVSRKVGKIIELTYEQLELFQLH